jgi:hypothetical protein
LVLPPEAVEAGIEFFGKQVTLVADALDVVIRLLGYAQANGDARARSEAAAQTAGPGERHAPLGVVFATSSFSSNA